MSGNTSPQNIIRLLCFTVSVLSQAGQASTVTTNADNGAGSLRQAIADAASGETIVFSVTSPIILTTGELLINKSLNISGPGAGALTIQRSTASRTPNFRIFNIQSGLVTISGLTVNNGRAGVGAGINNEATLTLQNCLILGNFATESGGGIYNLSTLTISNCTIRGNSVAGGVGVGYGGGLDNGGTVTALNCNVSSNSVTGPANTNGFGGGVNNSGTLALTNSTVNGNFAADSAGGIFNQGTLTIRNTTINFNSAKGGSAGPGHGGGIANGFGTVTLDRSTVSDNSVGMGAAAPGQGGGLLNDSGTVIVESSTISGNIATGGNGSAGPQGGGMFNGVGSLTINHSTITANVIPVGSAHVGGGVFNSSGVVEIKNTILARNTNTVDLFNGQQGDILSEGFNLFGSTNGVVTSGPSDRFNLTAAQLNLGPLRDNGGPTFTHALFCGSSAISAGDSTSAPATDQRGFPRIVGGILDIGAYESNNGGPTVLCPPPSAPVAPSLSGIVTTITIQVADADGNPLTVVWSVDGASAQTNQVPVSGPSIPANVSFTSSFGLGPHSVQARAIDSKACESACSTLVYVTTSESPCRALILSVNLAD